MNGGVQYERRGRQRLEHLYCGATPLEHAASHERFTLRTDEALNLVTFVCRENIKELMIHKGPFTSRESERKSDIASRWVISESKLNIHIEQRQRSMNKVIALAQCK